MKKLTLIIILTLVISNVSKSQQLPVSADTAIQIKFLMQVKRSAVRIAKNPVDQALYYANYSGNVYKIKQNGSTYTDTLIASATQHYINYLQGIVFRDSAMYLAGNHKTPNTAGYGLVVRGKLKPNGTWAYDTLLHTSTYQSTSTLFDHAFSGICLSLNGDSLYIGSGSRTDHGEVETSNGLFPDTREVPLTSAIFRIPVNPASIIFLPNDSATINASPYLFARGVRNSFDIAVAPNGDVLASENSGDRDDPDELNWLRAGKHYGFPWRMGGDTTPMQFAGYNANNDKLINHKSLGWGNGTTTNKFYNDPAYPQAPAGLIFTEPVKNYGPDADKFRSPVNGSVHDASNEGLFITSFTPHRAPLGLVFDNPGKLAAPYNYGAFILSYTQGTADTTGTLPDNTTGPFSDVSEDLLQLALFKDTATGQYSMNCYKIAWQFKKPVDAYLDNNVLYVIESHTPNDTIPPKLYSLTFPANSNGGTSPFLGKDTSICAGSSITLVPNLKGQYKYLWSTGSTASQITVSPTATAKYSVRVYNGLILIRDTVKVTVVKNPSTPGGITTSAGTTKVCPGETRTYTVALVAGITYNWTPPAGAVITNGQGTNSIGVTYNSGFTANGVLSVTANNMCGASAARNLNILRNIPATPTTISGTNYGLCAAVNKTYTVTNVTGITYAWMVPSGATIINGQGTNNITVNFPASNFTGSVSVKANNGCGTSAMRTLTVRAIPATPTMINGPGTVCSNSTGNAYNIAAIATATNYTWTGPTGSHITGNGSTSSTNVLTTTAAAVTVSYGTVTSTSRLKVRANNACGAGGTRALNLIPCSPRLNETSSEIQVEAYPNPSAGLFNLILNAEKITWYNMIIQNILGKEVFKKSLIAEEGLNEFSIDVTSIPSGIYILSLHSSWQQRNIKITIE